MQRESDEDRIRQKAHELWEAEGHPHGRDQDHWDQAREIIAIHDSQTSTLLPRDTGAEEPIESPEEALRNLADVPNLTDQGENLLTSTDRETIGGDMPSVEVPTSSQPGIASAKAKGTGGSEARPTPGSSSKPAQPITADPATATPKTASVPKVAAAKTAASSKKAAPAPAKKK